MQLKTVLRIAKDENQSFRSVWGRIVISGESVVSVLYVPYNSTKVQYHFSASPFFIFVL